MRITICCVGKVKEKFYCQAIDEYSKRLSRYCKLEVKEVADEKTPDNASDTVNDIIKAKEGERLLSCIKDEAYVITVQNQAFYHQLPELSHMLHLLCTKEVFLPL